MRSIRQLFPVCLLLFVSSAFGDDVSVVIDQAINARLREDQIQPAALVDDVAFIRRVTLDLAGRIPTIAEVDAYVASTDANKKTQLVDTLIASPDFAYHQRNEIDSILARDMNMKGEWREYLLTAARENRPWDRMFRDMLIGDDPHERYQPALEFLKVRLKDANQLTNDTSSLFFGVNISCAQCHDHPLVADWQQDHFFGMTAFFNRTYLTKKQVVAERNVGEVKFRTTEGVEKQAKFLFLTGETFEPPKLEWTDQQIKAEDEAVKQAKQKDDAPVPGPPKYSPRTQFVNLALSRSEQEFFSRSIANRIWARFFTRGIVHPLDQLHSDNPGSHPELLTALADDIVAHGYDLRRLIRGIVLSDTYARSSNYEGERRPDAEYFAVAPVRALTPRQYGLSLVVASWNPEQLHTDAKEWTKRRSDFENASNHIASLLQVPDEHFQVSVDEALYFSNSDRVQNDYLRDAGDRLIGYLKGLETTDAQLDAAFRTILSRKPDDEERSAFQSYLGEREDQGIAALQQVVWVLLTSPEIRFNY